MAVNIIVILAALLVCAATIFLSRRHILKNYNAIDTTLDRILAKDKNLRAEANYEDRLSKLVHKANRVMDMYISDATQNIREKEIIQGFISDMSHQMKTPLSSVSMYTDLLIEGNTTKEEQGEFLARVKAATDSLEWLMDSLIKMSRLEVGAIQLSPACQDIRPVISESIGNVFAAASRKNIEIVVADFDDMPLLHDMRWTQEAITNILENAIKYTGIGGEIRISVETLATYTKIVITDNGVGIMKAEWPLIFKRFFRGSNAKAVGGAGLGLYLAALIMEKQGGYIMVDSVVGEYTAFSLFLQNC